MFIEPQKCRYRFVSRLNMLNRFDLRFIPDDMTFTNAATDSCTAAPDPAKYQPKIFQTTALQQQKASEEMPSEVK